MSLEAFQKSEALSLGVELELQLVNTHDFDLAPYAEDMLRMMTKIPLPGAVVPEMTSSMIEISTGVCHSSAEVLGQLSQIRDALVKCADKLNIAVVGGGTHPFQQWHERRIYDKPRFRELSELYGYLSKQFTIFGQHVHVGCPDADTALLTLHRMSRYGFVQALAAWFMREQPFMPAEDDYLVYTYNRFQACRFGLDAVYVDPATGSHMPLREHILMTMRQIEGHAAMVGASSAIHLLRRSVEQADNDSRWLRERQGEERLLAEVIRQAAQRFRGEPAHAQRN
ncbi:MAG: hypothetical protein B7Y54_03930 [Polaromonas sp. 35-63-240]|nr:MAG: hypothetical protein B7Y54_03930 [Polaromonas sp. 35-63-240]